MMFLPPIIQGMSLTSMILGFLKRTLKNAIFKLNYFILSWAFILTSSPSVYISGNSFIIYNFLANLNAFLSLNYWLFQFKLSRRVPEI